MFVYLEKGEALTDKESGFRPLTGRCCFIRMNELNQKSILSIEFPSPYGEMLFHTSITLTFVQYLTHIRFPSPYGEMLFHTVSVFVFSYFNELEFPSPYGEMCFYT